MVRVLDSRRRSERCASCNGCVLPVGLGERCERGIGSRRIPSDESEISKAGSISVIQLRRLDQPLGTRGRRFQVLHRFSMPEPALVTPQECRMRRLRGRPRRERRSRYRVFVSSAGSAAPCGTAHTHGRFASLRSTRVRWRLLTNERTVGWRGRCCAHRVGCGSDRLLSRQRGFSGRRF